MFEDEREYLKYSMNGVELNQIPSMVEKGLKYLTICGFGAASSDKAD